MNVLSLEDCLEKRPKMWSNGVILKPEGAWNLTNPNLTVKLIRSIPKQSTFPNIKAREITSLMVKKSTTVQWMNESWTWCNRKAGTVITFLEGSNLELWRGAWQKNHSVSWSFNLGIASLLAVHGHWFVFVQSWKGFDQDSSSTANKTDP